MISSKDNAKKPSDSKGQKSPIKLNLASKSNRNGVGLNPKNDSQSSKKERLDPP